MATRHSKLVILGSGPAGYTAAIYAARANLAPVVISGVQPGGQLTITTDVENYPGFSSVIQGPWLMEEMRNQAQHMGADIVTDHILKVDLSQHPFRLEGDTGDVYLADALIVATGAQARWLGLPSEEKFRGFGVSACATCDGFFFRNRKVAVIGGGNTAVEEALYLANIAGKVTLIHRRDHLRAEKILQDRLFRHPNIEVVWNSEIAEICGSDMPPGVTHITLRDAVSGNLSQLDVDGVFIAIGHSPASGLFVNQLAMKQGGYIETVPGSTRTSVPGVFAAGDVSDDVYRQAVTAAGMGCMAALDAERWLATK